MRSGGGFLRQHYVAPLVTSKLNIPDSAWVLSQQWLTKSGRPASQSVLSQVLSRAPGNLFGKGGVPKSVTVWQYLERHGYMQLTTYQPASRFWPFQWFEGGWLLALSVLLIGRDRLAGPSPGGLKTDGNSRGRRHGRWTCRPSRHAPGRVRRSMTEFTGSRTPCVLRARRGVSCTPRQAVGRIRQTRVVRGAHHRWRNAPPNLRCNGAPPCRRHDRARHCAGWGSSSGSGPWSSFCWW